MAELSGTFGELLVGLEYWFNNLALYIVMAAAIWGLLLIPVVMDRFDFDSGYGQFASRMLIILMAIAGACSLLCAGRISILAMPSLESAKYTFYNALIYGVAGIIIWLGFSMVLKRSISNQSRYEDVRSYLLIALIIVLCVGIGLTHLHIGVLPFPV